MNSKQEITFGLIINVCPLTVRLIVVLLFVDLLYSAAMQWCIYFMSFLSFVFLCFVTYWAEHLLFKALVGWGWHPSPSWWGLASKPLLVWAGIQAPISGDCIQAPVGRGWHPSLSWCGLASKPQLVGMASKPQLVGAGIQAPVGGGWHLSPSWWSWHPSPSWWGLAAKSVGWGGQKLKASVTPYCIAFRRRTKFSMCSSLSACVSCPLFIRRCPFLIRCSCVALSFYPLLVCYSYGDVC